MGGTKVGSAGTFHLAHILQVNVVPNERPSLLSILDR